MRWEKLETEPRNQVDEEEGKKKRGRKGGRGGPGKKWGHTMNVTKGGKSVYVFGGYGIHEQQTNDVHIYSTVHDKWKKPHVRGVPPPPRDSHTCTLVGSNLFVFGGTNGTNGLNDLYYLDVATNTWVCQQLTTEEMPSPREGHAAACIGNSLYIFGGCGKRPAEEADEYFNDVFMFDSVGGQWVFVPSTGEPPMARDSHTCNAWGSKLVVFGGENSASTFLNDVHLFDTASREWTFLETFGDKPHPRAGHVAVTAANYLIVFGGFAEDRNLFNDLFVLDLMTGMWTCPTPSGCAPSPRFSLAADLADCTTGQILVYGGCNERLEALEDLYVLHTGLTQAPPPPLPRGQRSLEKDVRRKSRVSMQADRALVLPDPLPAPWGALPPAPRMLESLEAGSSGPAFQERMFEARITDVFHFGYFVQAKVDNHELEGMVFSFKPEFEQAAQVRIHQVRTQEQLVRSAVREKRKVSYRKRKFKAAEEAAAAVAVAAATEADSTLAEQGQEQEAGAERTQQELLHAPAGVRDMGEEAGAEPTFEGEDLSRVCFPGVDAEDVAVDGLKDAGGAKMTDQDLSAAFLDADVVD